MKNKTFLFCLLVFGLLGQGAFALDSAQENKAKDLYKKGRKKTLEQKWDKAIDIYEELVDQFPGSRYEDDAKFWIGYCLEKMPERHQDAFSAFLALTQEFPNSSWIDDAIIHLIGLAEEFVMQGKGQYLAFLKEQLLHELKDIRHQAALSLGRIGEREALPQLKEMITNDVFSEEAAALIAEIETESTLDSNYTGGDPRKNEIIFRLDEGKDKQEKKESPKRRKFLFFGSKRYNFYQDMLRKEDTWTKEELLDFGLWHILPTDEFAAYRSLTNEYDRSEWLRKFWVLNDPTPTTERNEMREEFERRVIYAKSHFYEYWNYNQSRYLQDQHIRQGWDHAPWDARGELYIKFGEPSFTSITGFHIEQWDYNRYGVTFLVAQYMTNIYGNAIRGNTITSHYRRRRFDIARIEADFVYQPDMLYDYNYQAKPLKSTDFDLINDNTAQVGFQYRISLKQFAKNNGERVVEYSRHYIVLNEDLREVFREEVRKDADNTEIVGGKVQDAVTFNLPPGNYTLVCRLEIPASGKLGIYKSAFSISN